MWRVMGNLCNTSHFGGTDHLPLKTLSIGHGCTHLHSSTYLGIWSRRVISLTPAQTLWWDPVSIQWNGITYTSQIVIQKWFSSRVIGHQLSISNFGPYLHSAYSIVSDIDIFYLKTEVWKQKVEKGNQPVLGKDILKDIMSIIYFADY